MSFKIPREFLETVVFNPVDRIFLYKGFTFARYVGDIVHMVIVQPAKPVVGCYRPSEKTLDEQINFVNKNNVESLDIYVEDNLEFIVRCPNIKTLFVNIVPEWKDGFDYSPLYELKKLEKLDVQTVYGSFVKNQWYYTTIDYSKLSWLKTAFLTGKGEKGYQSLKNVKNLFLDIEKTKSLKKYIASEELQLLAIEGTWVESLEHIRGQRNLREIQLYVMRRLRDISALEQLADSLKVLRIDGCSKIKDFSVLAKLTNLEELILIGNNGLPNLNFLSCLPHLKRFSFSYVIQDGDLSQCRFIEDCECLRWYDYYKPSEAEFENCKLDVVEQRHNRLGQIVALYADPFYPNFLVDKIRAAIWGMRNALLKEHMSLPQIQHQLDCMTKKINDLAAEFEEQESEIDTEARECIFGEVERLLIEHNIDIDIETALRRRKW